MPSEKILEAKKKIVADLVASYKEAQSFVFVDARGLTVEQDTALRTEMRKNGVNYKVVKNTTLNLVFKELGIEGLDEMFKGPTAVAYSTEDMMAPAKVSKKFADDFEKLSIKGGIIEGKVATVAEVEALAAVPSKDVLLSQIVYALLFPITKLAMLTKATAEKLEAEGGVAAAPAAEEAPAEEAKAEEAAPAAEEAAPAEEPVAVAAEATETPAE
ncbi:MAG: 50S ribosomal protein L10 [Clostridiales bacterium]|nr:50S ribosomal protein L10 [Clostridiales bacterium]